ncbi:DUF1048 domain-containing protein [Exiguobacterium indicum]|uniref:DUF1048 domain-containing protein n=1 Tax=Exiguobacterium indicum TaxID=296995 RepID=A0ABU8EDX8_9BACL|nr:hypothetical protein U719_09285 [Exiguobacterium sp. MH3]
MMRIFERITGSMEAKREWRAMEKRAKSLPPRYYEAYQAIQRYLNVTGGLTSWQSSHRVLTVVLELMEQAAFEQKPVTDFTGEDVAAFCDELVKDEQSWQTSYRHKLNETIRQNS